MDKAMQWLGGLLIAGVLFLVVPIGIAAAIGWTPAQTNTAMTGLFTMCGGSLAIFALGLGVALGVGATRGARSEEGRRSGRGRAQVVEDWELEDIKRQRAAVDYQRALAGLERDRRALLPAPERPAEVDPADAWLAELPAWEFIDAAQS